MPTVSRPAEGPSTADRFLSWAQLVSHLLDRPQPILLPLAETALRQAWRLSEGLTGDEAAIATRALWEGEWALAEARRRMGSRVVEATGVEVAA